MNFINSFTKLNEMETVHQIERMHAYPSRFYRLANILEKRPEFIFVHKIENNFFNFFDTSRFTYNSNNIIFLLFFVLILLIFSKIFRDQKKS